jgi:signal transduction histidine kinase/tetratricopeptide (TPR) repeat protein
MGFSSGVYALPDSLRFELDRLDRFEERADWFKKRSRAIVYQDPELALEIGRMWIEASRNEGKIQSGLAYNNLGILNFLSNKASASLSYYQTAWSLFDEGGDSAHAGYALRNLGVALSDMGLSDSAMTAFQWSLAHLDSIESPIYYALTTKEIGRELFGTKNFEPALDNFRTALRIMEREKSEQDVAGLYLDIALCLMQKGELSFADAVDKGLSLSRAMGDSLLRAKLFNVSAMHALKIGDMRALEQSIAQVNRALSQTEEEAFHAITHGIEAEFLRRKGAFKESEKKAEKALSLLIEHSDPSIDPWAFHEIYETLYRVHQQLGNDQKALFYALRSKESAEDLLEKSQSARSRFYEREVESIRKSRNRELQRLEANYNRERLERKTKEAIGYQLAGLLLLSLVVVLGINLRQHRKKQAELIENQREIERNRSELELLNSEKDRFMQIIGHDLRGPLSSSIRLLSFLEGEQGAQGEESDQVVHLLRQGLLENLNLLENLLSWGKEIRQGGEVPVFRQNLNPAIDRVLGLYLPLLQFRKMRFERTVSPALEAVFDRYALETVLRNLLANAIKYCPEGSSIRLSAEPDPDGLALILEDNGPGLPESVLLDWKRVDSDLRLPSRDGQSLGLGLRLCRDLVQSMGGRFEIKSNEGYGSRFEIRLRN